MNGGLLFRPAVPGSVRLLPPGTPILNRTMPEPQARSRWKLQSPPTTLPVSRIPTTHPHHPAHRFPPYSFLIHPARHSASARSIRHSPGPSAFHLPHAHTCHPPGTPAMNGGLLFRPAVPGSVKLLPPGTPILNRTMPKPQARSRWKSQSPPTTLPVSRIPSPRLFRFPPEPSVIYPVLPLSIWSMHIPVIHLERPQ